MRQRNCEKTGLFSCLGVEFLSLPWVALLFPQFLLLHSVPHVQLSLITILGKCSCQFPLCTLGIDGLNFFLYFYSNLLTSSLPHGHEKWPADCALNIGCYIWFGESCALWCNVWDGCPFVPSKEANESQKHVRTADTRKLCDNATVRKLACLVAWELSFLVFWVALLLPQFVLLHSVPRVQLSLITILGKCSCQFSWCTLGVDGLNFFL
jgi:hypothetical protein